MVVAKRQRKEKAWESGTKENLRTGVRTLGEKNSPPWPAQFPQGRLRGKRQMYKKRKPRWVEASPLGLACSHTSRVYFPLLAE